MVGPWLRASWARRTSIAGWSRRAGPSPIASIVAHMLRTKNARTLRSSESGQESLSCRLTGEPPIDDTDAAEVGLPLDESIKPTEEAICGGRDVNITAPSTLFSSRSLIYDHVVLACPTSLLTTRKPIVTGIVIQ